MSTSLFRSAQSSAKFALHPRPRDLSSGTTSLPYRVIRNSRGSLPVYTKLKQNGSQSFVLVRNVEGDANALLLDMRNSLFPPGSKEAAVFRGEVVRSKHLKLRGPGLGWKQIVDDWLNQRGF